MSNNNALPPSNGTVLIIAQIIKAVMLPVVEAEIGTLYINCWEAIPDCHTLEFLGHTQPPNPMQTNNTTALNVISNNVMKKQKAMDMKYYWFRCRESQGQFCHYWASGKTNNGDYITKIHAPIHHQATRPIFLTPIKILQELRGQVTNQPCDFFWKNDSRHGPTPLAYVPTYVRTFHSTPHHRVEWNKYWVAQQKWFHSTRVRTYIQTYITLHSRRYLRTNVLSTPLHITEWSGTKKEYEFIQKSRCWKNHQMLKKPDAENITRCWKSQMLKKLPDAEKASNLLPVARVC